MGVIGYIGGLVVVWFVVVGYVVMGFMCDGSYVVKFVVVGIMLVVGMFDDMVLLYVFVCDVDCVVNVVSSDYCEVVEMIIVVLSGLGKMFLYMSGMSVIVDDV